VFIVLLVMGFSIWGTSDPGVFLLWGTASAFAFCCYKMLGHSGSGMKLSAMFLLGALIHMGFSYLTYALFLDDLWGVSSSVGDYIYQALVICVVGFFAMVVGLGSYQLRASLLASREAVATPHTTEETILRRGYLIALLATVMAGYVYLRVGFLPLFTSDPNAVRYFDDTVSSTYQADYSLFRRSVTLFSIMLPFYWTIWKERRNFLSLCCCGVGLIVVVGSAQRIQIFIPVLTVLVMRFARGELRWKYILGTLAAGITFIVFTQSLFLHKYTVAELGILGGLASVFSEIRDLGWVLARSGTELLYGKTYLAAMIPIPKSIMSYKQVYGLTEVTKSVIGMADVDSFAGLRIMAFGEAFINFGYWGVIALGFFIGRLVGWMSVRVEVLGGADNEDTLSVYPFAVLWTQFAVKIYFAGSMALMDICLALLVVGFLYGPTQLFRKFRNFSLSRPCPSTSLAAN
jgi:oligosaccharide repeat unit polymerase